MKEITFEKIEEIANKLQSLNKKWHFHMLTPDCSFNKLDDKHAFVLENESDNENFVVYSEERNMELGQRLVKMIHGDKILNKEAPSETGAKNEITYGIIEKAKILNEKNIRWHHHMLFPTCIYNKNPGKWNIIFENKDMDEVIEALYDNEPIDDLREIEVLYYEQKN